MSPKFLLAVPLIPKMLATGALAGIGYAFAADAVATPPTDFVNELWTMVKVTGPVGFVLIWLLWRRDQQRWDNERADFKAEITRLHEGREAMQERTLTTLQQSRVTSEQSTSAILELTDLTRVLFEWLKDKIRDRDFKT